MVVNITKPSMMYFRINCFTFSHVVCVLAGKPKTLEKVSNFEYDVFCEKLTDK